MAINHSKILLYCAFVEIGYLGLSLKLATVYGQWSAQGEIVRMGFRLLLIVVYGYCYQRYFAAFAHINFRSSNKDVAYIALITALLIFALLYTNATNETLSWQGIFAVSGLTAGIREELLYRGMVQNYLETKYPRLLALIGASVLFILSHIQYMYFGQFAGLLLIACAGVIFGCIYLYSRSIIQTCLIHGLYDALLSINISPFRLNNNTAQVVIVIVMTLFILLINKNKIVINSK